MHRLAFAALVAAAALAGCERASVAPQAEEGRDDAAITAEVADLVRRWADAGESGQWDELKALYADEDGFAWIEEGVARYKDHASIVAGLDAARDLALAVDNDVGTIVVVPIADDAAALYAEISSAVRSDAFSYDFNGVLSAVAVKRDGAWRFLQGHLSQPPPTAPDNSE
ncbi:MAG: nuclear transport factor 2 family protein [Parvularculaceae bacterium]